jgi:hypothetical protein
MIEQASGQDKPEPKCELCGCDTCTIKIIKDETYYILDCGAEMYINAEGDFEHIGLIFAEDCLRNLNRNLTAENKELNHQIKILERALEIAIKIIDYTVPMCTVPLKKDLIKQATEEIERK